MAFGSYQRSHSHPAGMSNSEGIKMRLSDNVLPTPEVFLPHHFQLVESTVLREPEYTFDVEESFLKWTQDIIEKERRRELLESKKIEDQNYENHKHVKHEPQEPPSNPEGSVDKMAPEGALRVPPVQAKLGTDILMPTPSNSNKQTDRNDINSATHLFDLADFENVASDPFEATELQTLNVIEELKSVLASSSSAVPPPEQVSDASSRTTSSDEADPSQRPDTNSVKDIPELSQIKLESESVAFKKSRLNDDISSKSLPKERSILEDSHFDHDDLSQSLDNFLLHSTNKSALLNSSPLPAIVSKPRQGPSVTENNKSHEDFQSQRSRSKSSPQESMPSDSIPNHRQAVPPPGYPKNLSKYTPLPPSPSMSNVSKKQEEVDPDFSALDEGSKNFTTMITSMGFPKGRTARAVKRLGHDDKLVIDALCAIDRLCNKGFSEEKVEDALNLLDNDEEKILSFLTLMKRFEELGFKPDDIKRELLVHGNDEEKTLDALTAKS